MTDWVANKSEKINSHSSSKSNKNEAIHHHSSHNRKSSQPMEVLSRPYEDTSNTNDTFIKRYKIIEKIGEGSYSEVLKCQNRLDGTIVASKRLKHIYKSLEDVANISEIATLRSIQKHSNILQMIEIHYDKTLGKVSLVFELMDINLYELIKDRKRLLPESRVRAIMFQLFRALRHLHKLGIFHRDIKPENILIKAKTDQLKLGDLGSVRGIFSRPPYTEYISTRWYRSPECLLTAGHYSHKMDIWAAGCVFYEVLTLRPLFPGSSEIDQINRINNVLGPPPLKLLETFQKQAEIERETYRGQSQLNRRQQIQKVLNNYSSRYMVAAENINKNSSINRRNNIEFHFAGKEGTGLEKILPAHITREAKEIIKSCLFYDPEHRPTAQRIVQLTYFSELRESYSKNPEKVSSKPVLLICGDTVTDHCIPIELGTLGDNKIRYRRGVSQSQKTTATTTTTTATKNTASKALVDKKSSSIKLSTDINNNQYKRQSCSSTENLAVVAVSKASRSKLPSVAQLANSSGSKPKDLERNRSQRNESQERVRKTSLVGTSTKLTNRVSHSTERIDMSQGSPAIKSHVGPKNNNAPTQQQKQRLEEIQKKKYHQAISSTTSFESVQSTKERKYSKQRDGEKSANEPRSTILAYPDISLSPYVKPPTELKFLRNKIKSDQSSKNKGVPLQLIEQGMQPPSQKSNNVEQHHQATTRVSVVPPKVAVAAIKYAKVNSRRVHGNHPVLCHENNVTDHDHTESSGTNIPNGGGGGGYSPTDDTISYATASSVKIGKLRFRQTSQQSNQQKYGKTMKDNSTSTPSSLLPRSKIPVLMDDSNEVPQQCTRRSTKIMNSPPEQRHESGTTEKWRNTGIPRVIPMSPERERNIQLLKKSLTLDRNKRVKLRYQQQQQADQDLLNNNNSVGTSVKDSNSIMDCSENRIRKVVAAKKKYDYTSQDTPQSTGEQQQGNYSSAGGLGGGRCRNSTTDYENPDAQETSSASAAALENQQRNIFNASTRMGRVVVPPVEAVCKKPVPAKKSSELYPPEMLHLYSSRYRGPDTNMNILKDSGNSYFKRGNSVGRNQEVKEKLNHKFEQRRQQLINNASSGQQIGDQPSKIVSERNSYGHYSSSLVGAGEEEQFSRLGIKGGSRMERRPPLPPVGGDGSCRTGNHHKGYRGVSPDVSQQQQQYIQQHGQRRSMIPTPRTEKRHSERLYNRKSSNNLAGSNQTHRNFKESTGKKAEPRNIMRDDVFCSSDDDMVINMRKKFDSLISERAKKLSESLKTNLNTIDNEPAVKNSPPPRKVIDSNSEEDVLSMCARLRNHGMSDKARKYARRELRARMAESLTMNNLPVDDKWRLPELPGHEQTLMDKRSSKESGDWVIVPTKYRDKYNDDVVIMGRGTRNNNSTCNPSSNLRSHKNMTENDFQENLNYHPTSRIHPFPVQDHNGCRRGQIFTPPANKPLSQSPQIGTMLHDRQLRYTHNNSLSVSRDYMMANPGRRVKDLDTLKKRQRI